MRSNLTHKKKISIITPCFNEEGNIQILYDTLCQHISDEYVFEFLFIDDGSTDNTMEKIKMLSLIDDRVRYISFSRNFGHQYAIKAGLDDCTGDCAICMDSDMQHPPELLWEMISLWEKGYDVVYTIRKEDKDLSIFKRGTSNFFYWLINSLSDVTIKKGAADFRLTDRKVIDVFKNDIKEYYLFIRGMISWVGFRQIGLEYEPAKRFSGETKYSFKKMLRFALEGITSFSNKPLRISIYIGFVFSFTAFLYGFYALVASQFMNKAIEGWTSIIISVLFIGGIQLVMMGIIGEYLGKMFIELKNRPKYIVKEKN